MTIYHFLSDEPNAEQKEYIILTEDDSFDVTENTRPGFHLDNAYDFEGSAGMLPVDTELVPS